MKITLNKTKNQWSLSQEIPRTLKEIIEQIRLAADGNGLIKRCPQASWQAAVHLVPKDSKSRFRTTMDLRPANAPPNKEQSSVPII